MTEAIGYTVRGRLDLAVLIAPADRLRTKQETEVLTGIREVLNGDLLDMIRKLDSTLKDPATGEPVIDFSDMEPVSDLEKSEGEVVNVKKLEVLSAMVQRNPIGNADTFTLSVDWSALPVDPRAYEGCQFALWLYTHDDPDACRPGDAGNYAGIVDSLTRDRRKKTIDFKCRDFTAIPLEEDISREELSALDLDVPLFQVVEQMIAVMPNNTGWEVAPRGLLATTSIPTVALADERKTWYPQRTEFTGRWVPKPEMQAAQRLVQADLTNRRLYKNIPLTAPDGILNATELRNPMVVQAARALGLDDKMVMDAAEEILAGGNAYVNTRYYNRETRTIPAKVKRTLVKPTYTSFFGRGGMKVWKAVMQICGLMGVVPEVAISDSGTVVVVLTDVSDIMKGNVLRPFSRLHPTEGLREFRILTEGETIGKAFTEERDLMGGRKIDFVAVSSPNPDTGRILGPIRFGRPRQQGQSKGRGLFLSVPGVTSEPHLAKIAQASYYDIVSGELRVKTGTPNPWSDGGGPDDPDLLYCGAGAMFEIRFAGFEDANSKGGIPTSLTDILVKQGMSEEAAIALAGAQRRARTMPLFQVLKHTIRFRGEGSGSFASVLELQTYVGAVDVPEGNPLALVDDVSGQTAFEDLPDGG